MAQGTFGPVDKVNFKDYQKNLSANFISNLILIKSFLPFMLKKKYGHIINIASGTEFLVLKIHQVMLWKIKYKF